MCLHGRRKSYCADCGGSSICPHRRILATCRECKGSQICTHDRLRSCCKPCGGWSLCSVDNCVTAIYQRVPKSKLCRMHYIAENPDSVVTKRIFFKERAVLLALRDAFPEITIVHNRTASSCSRKRPDFLIDCGSLVLIVEVDEESHDGYDAACETARMLELVGEIGRPVHMVRFNPDKSDGRPSTFMTTRVTGELKFRPKEWDHRFAALCAEIRNAILADSTNASQLAFAGVRLFYAGDA